MGSIFDRTRTLDDGRLVRLRLARPSDSGAVRGLLEQLGVTAGDLELARLLSFDPRRRTVVCALAPIDGSETLVGIAAIELRAGAEADLVVADRVLGALLERLLRDAARSHARRVA